MKSREEVIAELRTLPGVSAKAAEGLFELGIMGKEELRGRDPVDLYEALRNKPGSYAEPCMLNQFKLAVKSAERIESIEKTREEKAKR